MAAAAKIGRFRVHLTNANGLGAIQLGKSLLAALELQPGAELEAAYLPSSGELSEFVLRSPHARSIRYARRIPNALSRLLECLVLARKFDGASPLLLLSDLPLRSSSRQILFLQNRFLVDGDPSSSWYFRLKILAYRSIFAFNKPRVSRFVVQTELMKSALVAKYCVPSTRVSVVAQPPPQWLLAAALRRTAPVRRGALLHLIYPADSYPHKNHKLLARIADGPAGDWNIAKLVLTVPPDKNPQPKLPWIECVGLQGNAAMVGHYAAVDGLLFLSRKESYGLPLVEAMCVGLPIVCPDMPYARILCSDGPIYFDPDDVESLRRAIATLHERLAVGWWPDWSRQLAAIPKDWHEVAASLIALLREQE